MHHLRHLLLALSLAGLCFAQDATKQLTNTHGEGVDTSTERSAWKTALELNNVANILNNYDALTSPTNADDSGDGYAVGSFWFDNLTGETYDCRIATVASAVWERIPKDSDLGSMAAQNADSVTISGGSITSITDLAVADGGTGASDAATARTNLGAVGLTGNETIAGAKTLSGQLQLTGQSATDANSAMKRGHFSDRILLARNIRTYPAFLVSHTGTDATSSLNHWGLGYPSLLAGTNLGGNARARMATGIHGGNYGAGGIRFQKRFKIAGSFLVYDMALASLGKQRFFIGLSGDPTMSASANMFTTRGIGFELGMDAGSYKARIVYYEGSYKTSNWVNIINDRQPFNNEYMSFLIENTGTGIINLTIKSCGAENGAQSLEDVPVSLTVSDGPAFENEQFYSTIFWQVANDGTTYGGSAGTLLPTPILIDTQQ